MSSTVSVKVEFSRPMTGAEIIDMVKKAIGNERRDRSMPTFFSDQRDKHEQAFTIGRTSSKSHEHLLVIPPRGRGFFGYVDYFRINQRYLGVEVLSQPAAKAEVEAFAETLRNSMMARR